MGDHRMNIGRIGTILIAVIAAGLASGGCGGSSKTEGTPGSGGVNGTGGAGAAGANACAGLPVKAQSCMTVDVSAKVNNKIDILFMIDNSSSMSEMQTKLYNQLPTFMNVLQAAPTPPDLHIAVVSSDMGAPGDSTASVGCTTQGDQGKFQATARGTCTDTTLQAGASFISDADVMPNYTDASLATVLQCIVPLGASGCGFEHQLASIDRALGADGSEPPSANAGFLRSDAYLGIVILTNEDDCSAPANTQLFSLTVGGSNQQNIANALGPITNYRCNQYGHLCKDPSGNLIMPPLNPPNGATTLDLTGCESNDTSSGLLTPVAQFVNDIKALKPDPDNQIVVAAVSGPPTPYSVAWVPEMGAQNPQPGEVWPEVEHSCGARGTDDVNPEATMDPTDGSFADPGVRIAQFVSAFSNFVLASICDPTYATSMQAIATKIGQLVTPPCITETVQVDANGNPDCSVIENVENNNVYQRTTIPNCATNDNAVPCWNLVVGNPTSCPTGVSLVVNDAPQNTTAQNEDFTLSCSVCVPGSGQQGCPTCVPGLNLPGCP
ncbi:MAG TPA: hypothetical protein VI456_00500 [Polyangia bacterium]